MAFKFLLDDLKRNLSQKVIGTDKGLAKIGDAIVNLAYSIAKSSYLTKTGKTKLIIRTGLKVSKTILGNALKSAELRHYARNRADIHDLADTVESIIAYVWLNDNMNIIELSEFLAKNLEGDIQIRSEEIIQATNAFTKLLNHLKQYLPEK